MKTIEYTVRLFGYWHCGSGLAGGAQVDALVVKDQDGLPYIPGRTIKGLVKEALQDIYDGVDIKTDFGSEAEATDNASLAGSAGCAFFGNAEMDSETRKQIKDKADYMYAQVSSTAIDSEGIARQNSLRRIEVSLPCTLVGVVKGISSDDMADKIANAMRLIKQLGQGRYHGLGRCDFNILKK